jgi:solute carrier family 38 (sodium-coupled neutral amino acid transporter), member 10
MNTVVGAGILALPYCFRENGIYATFAILPAIAVIAMFTLYLLSVVGESAQLSSLENVGFVLFGKWGRIMVELSIMGATFGAMTAYLVVIGDILTPFMEDITEDETMRHRLVVTLFPFLLAIVPLSMLKDFRALRFSSTASIISVFTFATVVVYEALKVVLTKGFPKEVSTKHPTPSSIIMTLPVFSFAFTAHVSLFPLYGELRNRSLPKIRWIIILSVSLCAALYTLVGFSGYILFLDEYDT